MNTEIISLIIFGCVVGAVLIGKAFHRLLPEDHLSADTKETVKLAMGLLATMSALLLGLLVASAKSSYDKARNQVIEMAAKVAFLQLVIIFLTFALIAPRNATATFALMMSAIAVATAIFLILELDRPFNGLLRIPGERILNVLSHLQNQGNK